MRIDWSKWSLGNRLNDVAEIAAELKKWSDYLEHCSKQGDYKEVQVCYKKIEQLFHKLRGY
jgi:hypothetical protein